MDPITLSLLVAGGTGLFQSGMGIADMIKGGKKRKEAESFYEKNKYAIPESAKSALGVAERQASTTRLPAEDLYRARFGEATAAGVGAYKEAATSASDVLAGLSDLYGQQMGREQDLAIAGAERYDRNQLQLQRSLQMMSDLERERWQYNVLYPYQQKLGQAEAFSTRGRQELGQGLNSLGQSAGQYATLSSAESQYQDYRSIMGLQSPYAGMTNEQKMQYLIARDSVQPNRQANKLFDTSYQVQPLNVSRRRLLPQNIGG